MENTDQDIVRSILAGEKRAYAELVNRHKDRAMTLAYRMLKNREDAEEALQDAFVRAFNALPRFECKSNFSTWLYRIVYNVCASLLSKKREEIHYSLDDAEQNYRIAPSSTEELPDVQFESGEFRQAVQEEIDRLSAKYSSVLTMFYVQEMGYEEIMGVTGMPLGTVKARLFRARAMLRDALGSRFQGEMAGAAMRPISLHKKENAI